MKPLTPDQLARMTPEQQQRYVQQQRLHALQEMKTNPTAVADRLRARGASEEQIQRVFSSANVPYSQVRTMPVQKVQPASATYGKGAYTTEEGTVVLPETPIQARDPLERGGSYTAPVTQIKGRAPAAGIVTGGKVPAPAKSDDEILADKMRK